MTSRREFLGAGGRMLAGLAVSPALVAHGWHSPRKIVEIRMRSDAAGSRVWFDPIGILVAPGTTIRWLLEANVHSTTAYHPANGGFAPRIPADAEPWDSGILVDPGSTFERTLRVAGVYDYFCIPHERAGMVGRIVVGDVEDAARLAIPSAPEGLRAPSPAALASFPEVERILREVAVRPSARG